MPDDPKKIRRILGEKTKIDLSDGFLLHVGGNQWYKNRQGVINIYDAWRSLSNKKLPLLFIGEYPSKNLLKTYNQSFYRNDIHFWTGSNDKDICLAYAGASVFLFPSLAEGFGWPIAEAMASGCPVVTTNKTPMTEVAGKAGFLIEAMPTDKLQLKEWATKAGQVIENILTLSEDERERIVNHGIINSARFDAEKMLDEIEEIYENSFQHKTLENKSSFYNQQEASVEILR